MIQPLELDRDTRILLVLRHGKSNWDAGYERDYDRPLAPRGAKAARKIGRLIAELELTPDIIVSSPAVRAVSTAELVAAELGLSDISLDRSIYGAGFDSLADIVTCLPDEAQVALLAGHNPGLEYLVEGLTREPYIVMKTCSLAVLESRSDNWSAFPAPAYDLKGLFHPRELPADL